MTFNFPTNSNSRGKSAEEFAHRYLTKKGLELITSNYRCRHGEIDLVMRDHDTLTFIEVRLRNSTRFGGSSESVTSNKQKKLIKTAQHYLQHNNTYTMYPTRFDVIAIQSDTRTLDWIKDAFQAT
ncbi:MAG: YraN family protein [Gammaproteobacteria bacterium]